MNEFAPKLDDDGRPIEYDGTPLLLGKLPDFSKPVCFIDFDGVINVFPNSDTKQPERLTTRTIHELHDNWGRNIETINIRYNEMIVKELKQLNAVWCTSWRAYTQSVLNPILGLDWGYVDWEYRGLSDTGTYGKINYIGLIVNASKCEWIVVDDSIFFDDAIERLTGKSGLLVTPRENEGLTKNDLNNIIQINNRLS